MKTKSTTVSQTKDLLSQAYSLKQLDLDSDARLARKGFVFETEAYDIAELGHLCVMRMCLIGYISIIFVMFSGARRLEIRQNKNYGSDPEYQKYVKSVPILVPFIPLYSVEKYKWLVA